MRAAMALPDAEEQAAGDARPPRGLFRPEAIRARREFRAAAYPKVSRRLIAFDWTYLMVAAVASAALLLYLVSLVRP